MKIKIITGFRADQHYTIDADEAHKAYYLFLNPEERGVFKNGVAIIGKNIQSIEPDYHTTMGWNPTHILGVDDYNELRNRGIDTKLKEALRTGKETAEFILRENRKDLLGGSLEQSYMQLPAKQKEINNSTAELAKQFSI